MTKAPDISAIREEFIERIGLATQADNLPRIAGRIFGMMLFDGETVSFGDLADRLDVSRASISTSVRLLELKGLIRRTAKSGDRQDYFELMPDPYTSMIETARKRTQTTRSDIAQTLAALPPTHNAKRRLQGCAAFYDALDAGLDVAIQKISISSN